ncbi:MAG TPA: hypothetical protein VFV50_17515 [Bdellovibrionales bacterium]|nr:hypothetical protein [Bdellovibrionales bacterium]
MKSIITFFVMVALSGGAFAQSAIHAFSAASIVEQHQMVISAFSEVSALREQIAKARSQRKGALIVGITSATVATLTALATGTGVYLLKSLKQSTKFAARAAVVVIGVPTSVGLGARAAKAFNWYELKAEEIERLEQELKNAQAALEAADRSYRVLNNG